MNKQKQIDWHYKRWQDALDAVGVEADRLKATRGQAVIGTQNPHFVGLVMHEIDCEMKYKQVAGVPEYTN